jgi:putative ABC transport system permease protein
VVAEFALAVVLVAGAGLAVRSFWNVATADLGIRTHHVPTFRVPLRSGRNMKAERIRVFYRQVLERIEGVPGVQHAALSPFLPAGGGGGFAALLESPASHRLMWPSNPRLSTNRPPGYYQTYGIHLTRGRFLNALDIAGGLRVAMVSESFPGLCARFWRCPYRISLIIA